MSSVPTVPASRELERVAFRKLLCRFSNTCHVVLIGGPVGIGKTWLLNQFRSICHEELVDCLWIDLSSQKVDRVVDDLARHLPVAVAQKRIRERGGSLISRSLWDDLPLFSQPSLVEEQHRDLGADQPQIDEEAVQSEVVGDSQKMVLLMDTGVASPTDVRRLYTSLQERLTGDVLLVFASRHRSVLSAVASQETITVLELAPLSAAETTAYLVSHQISNVETQVAVFDATRGWPLLVIQALSCVHSGGFDKDRFEPQAQQAIIKRALEEADDQRLRELLRIAAVARRFNAESLSRLANWHDISLLVDQLRELSYVEAIGPWLTITPYLRDAIISEWQASFPNRFVGLNKKALNYYESFPLTASDDTKRALTLEKIYHHLCIGEKNGLVEAVRYFLRAEALCDIETCRSIVATLEQFIFQNSGSKEWLIFFSSSLARLEYNWSSARISCEAMLNASAVTQLNAYLLISLSRTLNAIGNWAAAEYSSKQAINELDKLDDQESLFNALCLLGGLYTQQHSWNEALHQLNRAMRYSAKSENPLHGFQIEFAFAELFRSQGQWDAAREHLDRARAKTDELGSTALRAQVWHAFGKLHRSRHDWATAIQCYEHSVALYRETNDRLGQSQSLHSLGVAYLRTNQLDKANALFRESLDIKLTIGDDFGQAKSYNSIGHVKRLLGDINGALNYYERSLGLLEKVNNPTRASRVFCRIGMTLASDGRTAEAIKYFEQSKDIRLQVSDRQGVAETLCQIGLIEESNGDIASARASFELSLKFANESKSLSRQLDPLVQLAILSYRQGDTDTGSEYLVSARKIASETKQHDLLARLYLQRAKREFQSQQLTSAFLCCGEATYTAANADDETTIRVLSDTVSLLEQLQSLGNTDAAQDFARRLLIYWHRHCGPIERLSHEWTKLISSDSISASEDGRASLEWLKAIKRHLPTLGPDITSSENR